MPPKLIYHSSDPHNADIIYTCPHCKKTISGWELFLRKRDKEEEICPHCKKEVKYPK